MAKPEKNESREGKVYLLKSSAARAAKEDGLKAGEFQVKESAKKKGFYYLAVKAPDLTDAERDRVRKEAMEGDHDTDVSESVMPTVTVAAEVVKAPVLKSVPNLDEDVVRPTFKIQDYSDPSTLVEDAPAVHTNPIFVPVIAKVSDKPPPVLVSPPKSPKSKSHKSTVDSPTKLVWHIADDMVAANKNVSRKEVIMECERQGIAHFTARTQYQQWLTAKRESDKNAGKVGA